MKKLRTLKENASKAQAKSVVTLYSFAASLLTQRYWHYSPMGQDCHANDMNYQTLLFPL
jgi:hypothetical protein